MEYIDEVWEESPLLSQDPYAGGKARFWSRFADDKCVPSIMRSYVAEGEEKEKAVEEATASEDFGEWP
ncbi:glutathione s-transferase, putative [Ricinus communis]|uniref:Glutathione s-transferase, putative n=1 Tax=Ricinus communis TaxID=3988 RepID=B9RJS8_RICCO|nr:glutathione s-transferase, putative [Ricinus communis]